ncbi:hypothetical protein SAMN05661093_05185 [Kibdelosporangium aridum]|uniref:Uncharacterized protein n=2 Tax=Kibdelosporangium aridum TaxID=2030 RepID=A0A1W2EZJ4_KIBAR|nr:hypothetical protein SAMN05661093_05185 [Kibdelosporangium aridum]
MSNALGWAETIRSEGVVREPYGERLTASVDIDDFAAVVAAVLVDGGHSGQSYRVTGPEALTPGEKVRAIAAALGEDVRFEELTPRTRTPSAEHGVPSSLTAARCRWRSDVFAR